jgi:hypothetical protein
MRAPNGPAAARQDTHARLRDDLANSGVPIGTDTGSTVSFENMRLIGAQAAAAVKASESDTALNRTTNAATLPPRSSTARTTEGAGSIDRPKTGGTQNNGPGRKGPSGPAGRGN